MLHASCFMLHASCSLPDSRLLHEKCTEAEVRCWSSFCQVTSFSHWVGVRQQERERERPLPRPSTTLPSPGLFQKQRRNPQPQPCQGPQGSQDCHRPHVQSSWIPHRTYLYGHLEGVVVLQLSKPPGQLSVPPKLLWSYEERWPCPRNFLCDSPCANSSNPCYPFFSSFLFFFSFIYFALTLFFLRRILYGLLFLGH